MPKQQRANKGNPAGKRMQNVALKVRRAISWKRGQAKKEHNRIEQDKKEHKNNKLRKDGELTPWELSKIARKAARKLK
ncbi:MAG: hypothetical protein ACREOB_07055 [Thermodesulfobacteriota bacterium]